MRHVIGYFIDPTIAQAMVEELLARGVPRDHVVLFTDEDLDGSIASSTEPSPSTYKRFGLNLSGLEVPDGLTAPDVAANSVVTVIADNAWNETVLRNLMEDAGADYITIDSGDLSAEDPSAPDASGASAGRDQGGTSGESMEAPESSTAAHCRYDGCLCPRGSDGQYCSPFCQSADGSSGKRGTGDERTCGCGHSVCSTGRTATSTPR